MAKYGSVWVSALSLNFIGLICLKLNAEGYSMGVEPVRTDEIDPTVKIVRQLGITGQLLHTIEQTLQPNQASNGKDETQGRFCNNTYKTIDAAMRIDGKVILFVDKGHVIDERDGLKTDIETRFPTGPKWINAAVYSEITHKAYLFKYDKIYIFEPFAITSFKLIKMSTNLNKDAHDPECAFNYFASDIIYLVKRGYYYEFKPVQEVVVVLGKSKLKSIIYDITADAAFSTNNGLYFIIDQIVFKVPKDHQKEEAFYGQRRNFFFDKCGN